MPFIDLRTALGRRYDVCVIGSGPAGTAVALSLSEAGHDVLVVEAGSETPKAGPQAERSVPSRHAPLSDTNCQAFGGTSWFWGGRIMPFSKDEFLASKWPVAYDTYATYLDEAARHLGGSELGQPYLSSASDRAFDLSAFEMLADDGAVSQRHRVRLDEATGPDILLNTNVVGLHIDADSCEEPMCVGIRTRQQNDNETHNLRSRMTIVAAGGVETTRLLLAERARNQHFSHLTALGLGYCGHLTGTVARITFPKGQDVRNFGWRRQAGSGLQRRVFRSLAPALEDGINMFFWARNWPEEDAAHGSGLLSAKYLMGRWRRLRDVHPTNGPGTPKKVEASLLLPHLRNIATDAGTSLRAFPDLYRALRHRPRRHLDHLIPNHANCYKLSYHAEQDRQSTNHIELVGKVESDSLPQIRINFDFSEDDIDAVVRGHKRLKTELDASGLAQLTFEYEPNMLHKVVRRDALDGYHQIGTTVMGVDAQESVVDADCKVHGINGLYLAGSSIFRRSGAATPTHSIVAFALRLADHVSIVLRSERLSNTPPGKHKEQLAD